MTKRNEAPLTTGEGIAPLTTGGGIAPLTVDETPVPENKVEIPGFTKELAEWMRDVLAPRISQGGVLSHRLPEKKPGDALDEVSIKL